MSSLATRSDSDAGVIRSEMTYPANPALNSSASRSSGNRAADSSIHSGIVRNLSWLLVLVSCGGGGSNNHTLSVTADGSGGVTSAPAGISCRNGTCSKGFAVNSSVTLTAHPDAGASFTGWSGACTGSQLTCTVTMSADATAGAAFSTAANSHQLSVTVTGVGSVSSSPAGINCTGGTCSTSFSTGSAVTLTANPQAGSAFNGFSGACTGTSCSVTLSQDQAVTAAFTTPANAHKISVAITGQGSVSSSPAGINCPAAACSAFFTDGTAVSLSQTPDTNQTFSGWTGACSGSALCSITVSADASVGATFAGPGY